MMSGVRIRSFRPYIDLESDDSDQESFKAAHPEEAGAWGAGLTRWIRIRGLAPRG